MSVLLYNEGRQRPIESSQYNRKCPHTQQLLGLGCGCLEEDTISGLHRMELFMAPPLLGGVKR